MPHPYILTLTIKENGASLPVKTANTVTEPDKVVDLYNTLTSTVATLGNQGGLPTHAPGTGTDHGPFHS